MCVSVYVCLYAEWIKKLLINLIKSKSSVNTTHRPRMAIRTAAAAADQHKAVMEECGVKRRRRYWGLGTRTYAKSLMQVVKKKISNFLTACPVPRLGSAHKLTRAKLAS